METALTIAIVLAAVVALVWGALRRRTRQGDCGDGQSPSDSACGGCAARGTCAAFSLERAELPEPSAPTSGAYPDRTS